MFPITVNESKPRKLVNCGESVKFLLLVGKTAQRNKFDIYLNVFTGGASVRMAWACRLSLPPAEAKTSF